MTAAANAYQGLLDAMRAHGIEPTDRGEIVADGVLHRYQCATDKPGSRNGWFVLHDQFGVAGSWKLSMSCAWSFKQTPSMSRTERDAHRQRIRQAKTEAQRQREAEHLAAAERASTLWAKAKPVTSNHPYLVKKRIAPGNARQSGDLLVLRIEDVNGNIRSLQFISGDGTKKLLRDGTKKGCFITVTGALPAPVVAIAEGFATAMTAATQFPGAAVLAAIDACNLEPVAVAIRGKHPAAQIVICADDDRLTPGNPGLTKARAAAAAVSGKLCRPVWPEDAPDNLTDFNDLAAWLVEVSA